jgi:MGT family glycosyltransferase
VEVTRQESACDYRFDEMFERLVQARERGLPLIYGSLGTAAWRYRGAESFLKKLMQAAEGAGWNLLLAIGTELELPRRGRPSNVEVFQVVPQLRVLRHADVMVTHGGMNSITECLLSGVPMVVVPGTSQIDQAGNAARVVFHHLGLKGNMRHDSAARIRRKIDRVLTRTSYRRDTIAMGQMIRESDAYRSGADILIETVRRYYPMQIT